MAVYSASKFAVRGLTQSCGTLRYPPTNVNNYAPGGILTPMSEYNLYEPLTILTKKLVLHPDDDINGGPASTAKKASTNSSPW